MSQKSLMYMQENHKKYSKLCVYWFGPFHAMVFTGDMETMKIFLRQSGGKLASYDIKCNFIICMPIAVVSIKSSQI